MASQHLVRGTLTLSQRAHSKTFELFHALPINAMAHGGN